MQTGDANYIYRNELDKAYFQYDMAYEKYKDLKDKAFEIASNLKYDGYQRGLASMVYKVLIRNQKELVLNPCQINN